jgi:hypothetical protein
MLATFYWKLGLPKTLALCALLGALVHLTLAGRALAQGC